MIMNDCIPNGNSMSCFGLGSNGLIVNEDNDSAMAWLNGAGYRGKVRCVYIDPPYGTGNRFAHYNDNSKSDEWCLQMERHLSLLKDCLSDDGSIWVSIDDNRMPVLRLMMDKVFGINNLLAVNVWHRTYAVDNRQANSVNHEYVVAYAMDRDKYKLLANRIALSEKQALVYNKTDERGRWRGTSFTAPSGCVRKNQYYKIVSPSGKEFFPSEGLYWRCIESTYLKLMESGLVDFGKNGDSAPSKKMYLHENKGTPMTSWWDYTVCGHTHMAKSEMKDLFGDSSVFDTPKPEKLIKHILDVATNPGDIVLDSFAGSGTTGAVAMKMGRKFIMIERGEHCESLAVERMKKVIDGEQGGVSKVVGWNGGGGFQFVKHEGSIQ